MAALCGRSRYGIHARLAARRCASAGLIVVSRWLIASIHFAVCTVPAAAAAGLLLLLPEKQGEEAPDELQTARPGGGR